jgi:hypothetical protein
VSAGPEAPGAAQDDAAAERSAPTRAEPERHEAGACCVCGKPGAGFAARVLPPLVMVCGPACAADPRFARPGEAEAAALREALAEARQALGLSPYPLTANTR